MGNLNNVSTQYLDIWPAQLGSNNYYFLVVMWAVAVFILKGMKEHYGKHIKKVDNYNRNADRLVEDARRRNPHDDTIKRYCIHTYDPQTKAYYDKVCMYLDIIWPF